MKDQKTPGRPSAWAGLAARLAVGAVLAAAGTLKASAPPEEFSVVIEAFQVVPPDMALTLATFLPWIEMLVGFSLIWGFLTRQAAAAAGALLAAFLLALISIKVRGIALPNCGCFGPGLHPSPGATLIMDLFLAPLAFLAYKRGAYYLSLDNWVGH